MFATHPGQQTAQMETTQLEAYSMRDDEEGDLFGGLAADVVRIDAIELKVE